MEEWAEKWIVSKSGAKVCGQHWAQWRTQSVLLFFSRPHSLCQRVCGGKTAIKYQMRCSIYPLKPETNYLEQLFGMSVGWSVSHSLRGVISVTHRRAGDQKWKFIEFRRSALEKQRTVLFPSQKAVLWAVFSVGMDSLSHPNHILLSRLSVCRNHLCSSLSVVRSSCSKLGIVISSAGSQLASCWTFVYLTHYHFVAKIIPFLL